jgi:hypothetical protein
MAAAYAVHAHKHAGQRGQRNHKKFQLPRSSSIQAEKSAPNGSVTTDNASLPLTTIQLLSAKL